MHKFFLISSTEIGIIVLTQVSVFLLYSVCAYLCNTMLYERPAGGTRCTVFPLLERSPLFLSANICTSRSMEYFANHTFFIIWQSVIIVNAKYDIMSLGDGMQNRLRALRTGRGYTQISLQMHTGIEQALLSKFETGERVPPTETLLRLADFYNVSIDYILCRTDKPEINR